MNLLLNEIGARSLRIPDGPIDQRRERRVEFLGEQDGPAECELKTEFIKWFEGEPAITVA